MVPDGQSQCTIKFIDILYKLKAGNVLFFFYLLRAGLLTCCSAFGGYINC